MCFGIPTDNLKVPKIDKNNWAKTVEAIVLHLRLIRRVRGVPLVYVVRHHAMVVCISSGYDAYLNLDEEIIVRAPILDARSNLKQALVWLDMRYVDSQCDTFKLGNVSSYHIFSKIFTSMDTMFK